MQVKIFQANGFDQIDHLQLGINNWLGENKISVSHVSSAMCQIAEDPQRSERVQHLVVTVWFEELASGPSVGAPLRG